MPPLPLYKHPTSAPSQIGSVLAVAAGKGGVGKSTVAVNLALALKNLGLRVGLLDADVYGPSLGKMLPAGVEPVEDPQNMEQLLPALALGIPFISVAHFRTKAAIVRAPIANGIIEQFLERVAWGELDVLIIDFPPGTGDIQLTLMQKGALSAAIVVTTPQEVALLDVRKSVQLFEEMAIPVLGVVENMSYFIDEETGKRFAPFGEGGGALLAKEFEFPLLGQVPIDRAISEAGDAGKSLWHLAPHCAGAAAFTALGRPLWERLQQLEQAQWSATQIDSMHIALERGEQQWVLEARFVQSRCPCARCQGGKGKGDLEKPVSFLEFSLVGRYALRFGFSSGCSRGIYPFSLLKTWAN